MGAERARDGEVDLALLERERECEILAESLRSAVSGSGCTVLLTGQAGSGKTRLLSELTSLLDGSGAVGLSFRCQPLEQEFTFGAVLGLFQRIIGGEDFDSDLFEGAAGPAAAIFGRADGPEGGTGDTFPLLHGLYWLTVNLSGRFPLVLVVDDAQWADVPSLRFLNFIAARLADLPVLLAIGVRVGEAEGERAELIDQLSTHREMISISPAPLSNDAVATLIADNFSQPDHSFCVASAKATAGNPFLLRELIAELRSESVSATAAAAHSIDRLAPESLGRAVLLRLGHLHEAATALAGAVAVLGEGAHLRHAATLARIEPDEAGAAADSLSAAGIVVASPELGFAHPLIASTIYAEIPPHARRRLHLQAAMLLASEAAPPELLGAHLLSAESRGDEAVVEMLVAAAAEALAKGSVHSAAAYFERALAEPPNDPVPLLLELGRCQCAAGNGEGAIATLRQSLSGITNPAMQATAEHEIGRAQLLIGQVSEAAESFSRGVELAAGADAELTPRIEADLISTGLLLPGLGERLADRLDGRIGELRSSSLSPAGRAILSSAGVMALTAGRSASVSLDLADAALDGGRLLENEPAGSSTVYNVTAILSFAGHYRSSVGILDRQAAKATAEGSILDYATALFCRSLPNLQLGDPQAAIADARTAVDAERHGWRQYLPVAFAHLVRALIVRDELSAARSVLDEADQHDWNADVTWTTLYEARGRLRLAEGDAHGALADFKEWGERWPVPNPAFLAEWRSNAARAAAVLGDREQAVELASQELALVSEYATPRSLGVARRALGLATGGEEGLAYLREAVSGLAASEAVVDRAQAEFDLGAALRRAGQVTEARKTLNVALGSAQRTGARALERLAAEELQVAGGRPRSRKLSGIDSLSAGELRVARMASDGMTNREIAQALFVTPKAVEWHLRNTFRKLAIGSRQDLPALLRPAAPDE
ncbi:MAG: AAA family ATPase [Solirubrobacterales bacterium]|nr:AAA family ATPase [Solirubrobacterales bacterium]